MKWMMLMNACCMNGYRSDRDYEEVDRTIEMQERFVSAVEQCDDRVQTCVEGERYACLPSLLVLAHDEKSRKHQPIVVSASTHQQK
jgi:hypothetical protein